MIPPRPPILAVFACAALVADAGAAPRGLSVPAPCADARCDGDAAPLAPRGKRRVVVVTEGIELEASTTTDDAASATSFILSETRAPGDTLAIPPLDPADLTDPGDRTRAQVIAEVIDDIEELYAPYDVDFTTERPATGDYHMVVLGGACEDVAGKTCAGVAMLDCGDSVPRNISFVFPPGLRVEDVAVTAAQEVAHAFGLAHTGDATDVMYPSTQDVLPDRFGEGPIPKGESSCGGRTYQDSHALLLDLVGPRDQDTIPPEVRVVSPGAGDTVWPTSLVRVEASDDVAVARVEVSVDGVLVGELREPPWQSGLPIGLDAGEHELVARAYDRSENLARAAITFSLAGDDGRCGGMDDCAPPPGASEGGCRASPAAPGPAGGPVPWLVFAAAAALARSRRRATAGRERARRRRPRAAP